jgi:hypothetical protein
MDARLTAIFEEAAARNESPVHAAQRMVERRLNGGSTRAAEAPAAAPRTAARPPASSAS